MSGTIQTLGVMRRITPGMRGMGILLLVLLGVFLSIDAVMWKLGHDQTFSEFVYLESRLHWWAIPLYGVIAVLLGLHFFL